MNLRRPIPNIAFVPNVERRASDVEKAPSVSRRSTLDSRLSENKCSGMTLIELGVVMAIVTVLLALVLGLSRHVNEVIKIRRAQAELGEWHETLNTWFLKYGMYPDPYELSKHVESNLVWLASSEANHQYLAPSTTTPFGSLASKPLKTTDPWGTPYLYQSYTNSYELLSCGPNRVHTLDNGDRFPEESALPDTPNTDDIYFEP